MYIKLVRFVSNYTFFYKTEILNKTVLTSIDNIYKKYISKFFPDYVELSTIKRYNFD